jgi:hypothetical protein
LRKDISKKGSFSVKRSMAGWDTKYRETLLHINAS